MNIKDLVLQTDEAYLKTILSSGDLFPGFYRYNLGPRRQRLKQLQVGTLLQLAMKNHRAPRDVWLSEAKAYYEDLEHRDLAHSDVGIINAQRERYYKWMLEGSLYRILIQDTAPTHTALELNQSYFFMGSIIHFKKDRVLIGYEDHTGSSARSINADVPALLDWLHRIYEGTLDKLFLPSVVVGELWFPDGEIGEIFCDEELILQGLGFNDPVVFASNGSEPRMRPISWAKDIILTEIEL